MQAQYSSIQAQDTKQFAFEIRMTTQESTNSSCAGARHVWPHCSLALLSPFSGSRAATLALCNMGLKPDTTRRAPARPPARPAAVLVSGDTGVVASTKGFSFYTNEVRVVPGMGG